MGILIILFLSINLPNKRLYIPLLIFLLLLSLIALFLNDKGKYKSSLTLTISIFLIGVWIPIYIDAYLTSNDLIPFVYLSLAIYMSAYFLTARITIFITVVQIIFLVYLIKKNPYLYVQNWISLIVFIVFIALISIINSIIRNRQIFIIDSQKEKLYWQARKDPLTGIYNRLFMEEFINDEFPNFINEKKDFGLIIIDIDDFKSINDTFGHFLGDQVIKQICNLILSKIRLTDVFCRLGGDEFILIAPNCSPKNLLLIAENLREAINKLDLQYEEYNINNITVSIGVANINEKICDWEDLLRLADRALYKAKKNGRNKVYAELD